MNDDTTIPPADLARLKVLADRAETGGRLEAREFLDDLVRVIARALVRKALERVISDFLDMKRQPGGPVGPQR